MRYNRVSDCFASSVAEQLAYEAHLEKSLIDLSLMCKMLSYKRVCIAGGSASLEEHIGDLSSCDTVIAVDGATTVLVENNVMPSIVVTDVDGRWSSLLEAAENGSYLVIHVHGDNYQQVTSFTTMLARSYSVLFSHQCPGWGRYSVFIPGFTDGERALGLALMCKPKTITLYGMRTWEKVGHWSKPWLHVNVLPWPSKLRKLRVAEFFIRLFTAYGLSQGIMVVRR